MLNIADADSRALQKSFTKTRLLLEYVESTHPIMHMPCKAKAQRNECV